MNSINKHRTATIHWVPISSLLIKPELKGLFTRPQSLVDDLWESIKEDGFSSANPITVCNDRRTVIDGHTRLQAAKEAGLDCVPVVMVPVNPDDIDRQISIAIRSQKRRSMTREELAEFIKKVFPNLLAHGSNQYEKKMDTTNGGSTSEAISVSDIAALSGKSERTVQREVAKAKEELTPKASLKETAQNVSNNEDSLSEPSSEQETEIIQDLLAIGKTVETLINKMDGQGISCTSAMMKAIKGIQAQLRKLGRRTSK